VPLLKQCNLTAHPQREMCLTNELYTKVWHMCVFLGVGKYLAPETKDKGGEKDTKLIEGV
jgi:hypothetical protein